MESAPPESRNCEDFTIRTTLVHNPSAGRGEYSAEQLLAYLQNAGHKAVYVSTDDRDWREQLSQPTELIVVAGGDGTVDKVAVHMAFQGVPLTILPVGTANNIASALKIVGDPKQLLANWPRFHLRPYDLGRIDGLPTPLRFAEATGVGLFAELMRRVKSTDDTHTSSSTGDELNSRASELEALLGRWRAKRWTVVAGETILSGEYLMVDVMNINTLGPRLTLAPNAEPGDGLLDVVLIGEDEREALAEYLARSTHQNASPPNFPVHRTDQLEIGGDVSAVHVDGRIVNMGAGVAPHVTGGSTPGEPTAFAIRVEAAAVEFLAPAQAFSSGFFE